MMETSIGLEEEVPHYDIIHPKTGKPCKVPKSGWRYQEDAMNELLNPKPEERPRIAFKATHLGIPRSIEYLDEMDMEVRTSIMERTGQRAVEVVDAILGKGIFKNPKDHEMLAEIFNLVTWRDKEAAILDPYAGSGTTGHAVLTLNQEDGGSRRFVMIDSGDPRKESPVQRKKYTKKITAERIRRVITGQWTDGGNHPVHETGFHFLRANEEIFQKGHHVIHSRGTRRHHPTSRRGRIKQSGLPGRRLQVPDRPN